MTCTFSSIHRKNGGKRGKELSAIDAERAVHEEYTTELVDMVGQLKSNLLGISSDLQSDAKVVDAAHDALDGNLMSVNQEVNRLKEHNSRTLKTTCLTFTLFILVIVIFLAMYVVMKIV